VPTPPRDLADGQLGRWGSAPPLRANDNGICRARALSGLLSERILLLRLPAMTFAPSLRPILCLPLTAR